MTNGASRYDRNILLFGKDGQEKLRATTVAVVGCGGLGSPLIQQLALLGVGKVSAIDDEELDETNRNRFVGARHDDPVPGSKKVDLVCRLVNEINPDVVVDPIPDSLLTERAFSAIKAADFVFGCFDDDGPRFILNELCSAYSKPYIDLASDVPEAGRYGGRVCVVRNGDGCLICLDVVDMRDVNYYLASEEQRKSEREIYGIAREALDSKGPSVAPINAVVSGLAAMEFMVAVTGLREPCRLLNYNGHLGTVRVSRDDPAADCYTCTHVGGKGAEANVERYLSMSHLRERRRQP